MVWNQSRPAKARATAHSKGRYIAVIVLALTAIIVAAVLALYYSGHDSDDETFDQKRKTSLIQEAKSAPASKVASTATSEKTEVAKYKTIQERHFAETNGLSKTMMAKWRFQHRPPAAWTNDSSKIERPEYATFEFNSEKEIICLLTVEPGDMLIGDGNYDEGFVSDFLKSLERPIIVSDDDSPEQAEWKRMMIETKIDLKARLDAGEDIAEIMRATRKEYQRLSDMKDFLRSELKEMQKSGNMTMQDMEDSIEAANKLLESKGVAGLKLSPLMKRALMRKCSDFDSAKLK